MGNKKRFVVLFLSIILTLLLIFLGHLIFHFYFLDRESEFIELQLDNSNNCAGMEDNYILPNFKQAESILSEQQIVKEVPSKAKISLKFYHFIEDCRKWDKIYLLRDGKIEEKNIISDIDIWISSDYVDKLKSNNLCEVIVEAKEEGDLGQSVNVGKIKLMWTYKNMLKYKECLGL